MEKEHSYQALYVKMFFFFPFLFSVKMLSCFLLDPIYLEVLANDVTLFVYL